MNDTENNKGIYTNSIVSYGRISSIVDKGTYSEVYVITKSGNSRGDTSTTLQFRFSNNVLRSSGHHEKDYVSVFGHFTSNNGFPQLTGDALEPGQTICEKYFGAGSKGAFHRSDSETFLAGKLVNIIEDKTERGSWVRLFISTDEKGEEKNIIQVSIDGDRSKLPDNLEVNKFVKTVCSVMGKSKNGSYRHNIIAQDICVVD